MPIAHWVDYRFHKNQWTLSGWVMNAALAMNVANSAHMVVRDGLLFGGIALGASGMMVWLYFSYVRDMKKASDAYERRPDQISFEQGMFIVVLPSTRFLMLFTGSLVFDLLAAAEIANRTVDPVYLITQPAAFLPAPSLSAN